MKKYIALEDVSHPQAKVVTDVEICREFAEKIKDTLYYCDDLQKEYGLTSESGFMILDLIDRVLAEMED